MNPKAISESNCKTSEIYTFEYRDEWRLQTTVNQLFAAMAKDWQTAAVLKMKGSPGHHFSLFFVKGSPRTDDGAPRVFITLNQADALRIKENLDESMALEVYGVLIPAEGQTEWNDGDETMQLQKTPITLPIIENRNSEVMSMIGLGDLKDGFAFDPAWINASASKQEDSVKSVYMAKINRVAGRVEWVVYLIIGSKDGKGEVFVTMSHTMAQDLTNRFQYAQAIMIKHSDIDHSITKPEVSQQ